ncbi:hypothetical protein DFH06DRAFT_1185998 [Mycena polygramma]|nr:hypothetical protein DFH06DRAFT_1185998 [Mycena polygramma]
MTAATTSSLSVSETSASTSLLHDQIQRRLPPSPLNGTESGKGSEPASVIHGLLQRRPSLRPQASEASAPTSVIHGLLKRRPPSPLVDQQQQQLVPDLGLEVFNQGGLIVSSVPSAAPIRRRLHRIVWRNALPFLLGLPALGLLTTIARLLLPPTNIPRVVDVCRVAQEPLPPPLPIAAPELPVPDDLKPDPPLVIPSPGPGPALPAPPVPASFPQETELQIEAKRLFGVTLAQTWDLHRQYERRILDTERRIRELERQEWELFVVTLARTWDSHRQNKRQISETERRVQELERQEWERVQTVLDG